MDVYCGELIPGYVDYTVRSVYAGIVEGDVHIDEDDAGTVDADKVRNLVAVNFPLPPDYVTAEKVIN